MENLGTYFLIALAIAFVIYYSKKKNTSTPKGKAPSKPRTAAASKPSNKKGGQGPKKGEKTTGTSSELSSGLGTSKGKESANTSNLSEFDLMAAQAIQSMGKGDSKSLAPNQAPSTPSAPPNFDLESEVKQLQSRTGWDYAKAKAYCEQALQYQTKIGKPARLKNS
jgi:hypothetical protein